MDHCNTVQETEVFALDLDLLKQILDRGNTAEVKRRKGGEIIVLEVQRRIKAPQKQNTNNGNANGRY